VSVVVSSIAVSTMSLLVATVTGRLNVGIIIIIIIVVVVVVMSTFVKH